MINNRFAKDASVVGLMTALLTVGKMVLSFIPNIEVVSFMIIMFCVYFGRKTLFAVFCFVLIEGLLYGFGMWWIGYIYIWPLLALLSLMLRKSATHFSLTVLSTLFGLFFGFLSSFPYIFIGTANPGIGYAVTWWIAGIPYDIIHGAGNLAVMICLYKPIAKVLRLVSERKVN